MVGFAVGISLLTGLLAGSLPAIRAMGRNLTDVLKTDPSGGPGRGGFSGGKLPGLRDLLMSVQVALSVVLLVVSGLVLQTLVNAGDVDPGFEYEQLIGSHISTSSTSIVPEDRERFFREVEERISMEPWVRSATVSGNAPLSGHGSVNVRVVGAEEPAPTLVSMVHFGFFEKLGIELVAGRTFAAFDNAGAAPVAVLNRPAAERFFPDGNAVAGRVWLVAGGGEEQEFEVVGVVGDTKTQGFSDPPGAGGLPSLRPTSLPHRERPPGHYAWGARNRRFPSSTGGFGSSSLTWPSSTPSPTRRSSEGPSIRSG